MDEQSGSSPGVDDGGAENGGGEQPTLRQLRALDKGVPHLRKLRGELAIAARAQAAGGREADVQHLMAEVAAASQARTTILRHAQTYVPQPMPGRSQKRVVLHGTSGDSAPSRPRSLPFKKALVMGVYHSCTNAAAQELEKRFAVEVINDWHTGKADLLWKHRVNSTPLPVGDDCLILLMTKEPRFWLKSCSKAVRQFFEIHPFEVTETGDRRDVPAKTLQQLLAPLEHDAVIYPNAVAMYNDTIHSYFDDTVYPPDRSVIVRSEDFLFRFHEVMDELATYGLAEREQGVRPEPLADRAKGHIECRTRDQALQFYGDIRNWKSGFTAEELGLVARDVSDQALERLGYDGPNPFVSWTSFYLIGSWDGWKELVPLRPARAGSTAWSTEIRARQAPGKEEFQIVQDRDWSRRYFPMPSGEIMGPDSAGHGANWQVPVPAQRRSVRIRWDPSGDRTVSWDFLA